MTGTKFPIQGTAPGGASLVRLLKELQGLRFKVLAGTTADTNIAVAGIAVDDVPLFCLQFDIVAGHIDNVVDLTSEVVILTAGNVQLTDTNTTGDKLLLIYADESGG